MSAFATICISTHGDRLRQFRRCLESVLAHSPPGAFDLHLGFVQASASFYQVLGMFNCGKVDRDVLPGGIERYSWNEPAGGTVRCWHAAESISHEAMARLIFFDSPLTSRYAVVLDDDVCLKPDWWTALEGIAAREIDYFGQPCWIDYLPAQAALLKSQSWYAGVPFLQRNNRQGCLFMAGFRAVRTVRLRGLTLPDSNGVWQGERYKRIDNDVVLGEMARQLGWSTAEHAVGVQLNGSAADSNHEATPSKNGDLSDS